MFNIDIAIIELVKKWNGWGLALFTLLTCLIAGLCSSLIGIEREMKGQAAGLRTHVLVGVGSCMLMIISVFGIEACIRYSNLNSDGSGFYNINLDVSRIASGILSGIGFMGAGAIVKNGLSIRGLTTAATLWLVAAIGMACGCGFIIEALIVTVVAMLFLLGLEKVEKLLDKGSPKVSMVVAPNIPILHEIRNQAEKYRLVIKNIITETSKGADGRDQVGITIFFAYQADHATIADFVESFSAYPYVYKIVNHADSKNKKQPNE